MIHRLLIATLLLSLLASQAFAQDRTNRRRGAILGGLAGAGIGVAIGDKGNNETAGALIGGAVGAIAGGTIGNQRDQRIEHDRRDHSGHPHRSRAGGHPIHSVPPPIHPVHRRPWVSSMTAADVIQMHHRGLSEAMILRQIQLYGVAVQPSVGEVIDMHQFGVSERVIAAMQGDPVVMGPPLAAPFQAR